MELVALLREVAHLRSGPAAIVRNYVRSLLFQGLLLVLLLRVLLVLVLQGQLLLGVVQ